jgi:hypothetical protein
MTAYASFRNGHGFVTSANSRRALTANEVRWLLDSVATPN